MASVSRVFEYLSIASLVICWSVSAAGLIGVCVRSWIPAYAITWAVVVDFAPCRLNSLGFSRLRRSQVSLLASSFARASFPLFPSLTSWPLTH